MRGRAVESRFRTSRNRGLTVRFALLMVTCLASTSIRGSSAKYAASTPAGDEDQACMLQGGCPSRQIPEAVRTGLLSRVDGLLSAVERVMDQTLDCLEILSTGIVGLRSKDADFKEAEETVQHDTVVRVTANPAAESSEGSHHFDPSQPLPEDHQLENHHQTSQSSSSADADAEEPDRWVAQSVPGYDGGSFDEEEESGMRWLLPVEQELLHTHTQTYLLETLLPPSGDFQIKVFLDKELVLLHSLNCSSSCPGAHREGCTCRCGPACDCARCLRPAISHVIRVQGGPLQTGVHQLQAMLAPLHAPPSHLDHHDPQVVSSYFHVLAQWLHAFEAPSLPTPHYPHTLVPVSAPRYRLPAHHYNFLPFQATGMGVLWPGITVRRPVPAEVFGRDEEVVLEIELLDYSDTDRLRVWLQGQDSPEACTGPKGCGLSEAIPLEVLPSVLPGAKVAAELNCADSECRRRRVSSIVLPPGDYRFLLTLADRHGRDLSGTRTRAFRVDSRAGKDLEPEHRATWHCPEVHCGPVTRAANATETPDVTETTTTTTTTTTATATTTTPAREKGTGGARGTGARVVLLVYEWPPLAAFSGDADRARQLVHALSALHLQIHFVSRSCGGWLGDALSMVPRAVGPRFSCGLKSSDIPAYLNEFERLDLVLLLSTFWFYPQARSFPEEWVPHIRDAEAAASAKIIVMADVLTSPNALGINDVSDRTQLHSHGAQLLGFAAADAAALENPEDAPYLRAVLPALPSFLVRFAATDPPLPPHLVPGFDERRGLVWVGSGHADNVRALEWVVFKVLPLLRKRLHKQPEDATLVVVGGGLDDKPSLQGVEGVRVLGHQPDLGQALGASKVCVSPTILSSPRFQTKHLQALSRGVPVVTTAKGATGYRLVTSANASCAAQTGTAARDCGWPGIDEEACTRSACCFVPAGSPACIHPTMPAYAPAQGLVPASRGLGRLLPADGNNGQGNNADKVENEPVLDIEEAEAELFAEAVVTLVTDKKRWEAESKGALQRVTDHFQQKHVDQEVRTMVTSLLR